MAGDKLEPPSANAQTSLTPLYPDTQNETARNLTKVERAAVLQRVKQLVLDLKTRVSMIQFTDYHVLSIPSDLSTYSIGCPASRSFPLSCLQQRFDPSAVASEKTCQDISKFLPASLAHKDERDEVLEILRNLMTTSFDLLHECFIKGGSRDDLKRPNWLFARGKDDQGTAMESLLASTFWALFVSSLILSSADQNLNFVVSPDLHGLIGQLRRAAGQDTYSRYILPVHLILTSLKHRPILRFSRRHCSSSIFHL